MRGSQCQPSILTSDFLNMFHTKPDTNTIVRTVLNKIINLFHKQKHDTQAEDFHINGDIQKLNFIQILYKAMDIYCENKMYQPLCAWDVNQVKNETLRKYETSQNQRTYYF